MHVIIGNFANESIALIQWAMDAQLSDCYVVSVDTGWAAQAWAARVASVKMWVEKQGLHWVRLKSAAPFADWVRDRGEFPTPKHQWCAGLLKGAPINAWLDEQDVAGDAVILLGKRRAQSRLSRHLPETIAASDHYSGRKIWHPLYNSTDKERDALLERAGFAPLAHRSLECDPCARNSEADFRRMDTEAIERTKQVEESVASPMFCPSDYKQAVGIEQVKATITKKQQGPSAHYQELFDMGCGSPWGCGE